MVSTIHQKVKNIPTPVAGLALGIASVMWSWENAGTFQGNIQLIGATIGAILLMMLLIKFILNPSILLTDLAHPVIGSVVPTFAMALMVVSATIGHYSLFIESIVWCIAVALHLLFLVIFIYHRAKHFKLEHMVPSWFVPPIGIIVAAVSVPASPVLHLIAYYLQNFGMICYAIMLPMMIYRFMFIPNVAEVAQPTLAIMAAPASLSLAGYLTVETTPSFLIISLLFGIALLMTVLIYFAFFHLLRLPFSPGYSAFTFPMAIGATALFKLTKLVQASGFNEHYIHQLRISANIELIVASMIIAYVAIRYLYFYLPKLSKCTFHSSHKSIVSK